MPPALGRRRATDRATVGNPEVYRGISPEKGNSHKRHKGHKRDFCVLCAFCGYFLTNFWMRLFWGLSGVTSVT
jgi:hypothetical protein